MGQWTNYMKIVTPKSNNQKYNDTNTQVNTSYDNYSWYKNVIMGPSNRQQKYSQYDQMDTDYDISRGLDIIAEEIATRDDKSELPFEIKYNVADNKEVSEGMVITLRTALRNFCKQHALDRNAYVIARITIKNGDCFMRKYGDFKKWKFINPADVFAIELDENEDIAFYHIKYNNESTYQYNGGKTVNVEKVPAHAIVHFSMSEAFSDTAPFGESILKSVLKVYKQKTLIEDAIVIYRIVRAPERRIFYVDVGNNPPQKAKAILESVKNEVNQKRVASNTGGTADIDSVYNPMCLTLDTRIPLLDGRTLSLTDLITEFVDGKQNWVYSCDEITGEIKPGVISWAGITKKNTKVLKLTLSNGNVITCTPDHKFPVLNKGFVEAQNLTITDELIGYSNIDNKVYDAKQEKYISTSRIVADFFKGLNKHREFTFSIQYKNAIKNIVTHIDGNVNNNHPVNLQFANNIDYFLYKKFVTPEFFQLNQVEREIEKKNILINLNKFIQNNQQINELTQEVDSTVEEVYKKVFVVASVKQKKHTDVGCITIDGEHKYHAHHTFALEAGIFTKNSMMEDYFFSSTCLNPQTKIKLLDDRTITMGEAIVEYEQGKQNYVYSLNRSTLKLEAGLISWAGYTRKNAQQVRVYIDNDTYVDATPDHRFILRDGTEIEAQYLQPGDSLMPLYTFDSTSGPNQKEKKYKLYMNNRTGKKEFVHLALCPKNDKTLVVHHKDFDSRNNNPDNLEIMNIDDHTELHRAVGSYSLKKQWDNAESRDKIIAGMRKIYDNQTEELKAMLSARNKNNMLNAWKNEETRKKLLHCCAKGAETRSRTYCFEFNDTMFNIFKNRYIEKNTFTQFGMRTIQRALIADIDFMTEYKKINVCRAKNNKCVLAMLNSINFKNIHRLCQYGGYKDFFDFHANFKNNHKVVGIEWLDERADTCDITIESPSNSHIFALDIGIYVHNSNGRGSRVETLAGGAGLDQLADLEYFKKGLLAGLRVPTSYINGSDGGGAQYNDGKVGVAYIEELRFANMIKRYQLNFEETYNIEFKTYLTAAGIVVDNTLFDIRLPDPQNFALYRQSAINSELISTFAQADGIKYLSKRFILDKFLCLTEDEKQINEMLIRQERGLGEEDDDSIRKIYDEAFTGEGEAPDDSMGVMGMSPEDNPDLPVPDDTMGVDDGTTDDDLSALGSGDISDTGDGSTQPPEETASPLTKNMQK